MQDYLNAIDYYQKALVICEANFGENSYTTAECLNNLAVTYLSMNDNQKALDCLQRFYHVGKNNIIPLIRE